MESLSEKMVEEANAAYACAGANAGRTAADFKHIPALRAALLVAVKATRAECAAIARKCTHRCGCELTSAGEVCNCGAEIAREIEKGGGE